MAKTLILDPPPTFGPQTFSAGFTSLPLLVVPSYRRVQFKGKLKNQTLENGKKNPNLGPDFSLFAQFGPINFFCGF